jgi:methionyl-tRNA formyltransferase
MSYSLVVVTADGPEHRYVTNRICEEFEVAAILVTDPAPRRSWKKVLKSGFAKFLDKSLWRLFLKAIRDDSKRAAELDRVLGARSRVFEQPQKVLRVGRPKAGGLLREVERLAPEFLAVYGTAIIPDAVLDAATKRSFNMHTGISPFYRGTACAFWPLYFGEPEQVGATVHECTSDVDGGEIYFTGKASLYRDESVHSVFARAAAAGAEGYVAVLRDAIAGTLQGKRQDLTEGREFRGSMRGLRSELLTRLRLRRMRRHWPPRE